MKHILKTGLLGCILALAAMGCNGTRNNGYNEDSTGTMGAPGSADGQVNTNPPPQMTRDTSKAFLPSDSGNINSTGKYRHAGGREQKKNPGQEWPGYGYLYYLCYPRQEWQRYLFKRQN